MFAIWRAYSLFGFIVNSSQFDAGRYDNTFRRVEQYCPSIVPTEYRWRII